VRDVYDRSHDNGCTVSEFHVSVDVTGRSTFQCLSQIPSAKDSVETRNATSYIESARFSSRAVSIRVRRFFTP